MVSGWSPIFSAASGEGVDKWPSAVAVRPRLIAQRRRIAAARLAESGVLELSRRPPEILLLGASVCQEVKWSSLGQRRISVPISASSCSAACGPMASIWLKSAPPVTR
ncbi:MAG TPA: hypothetical protein VMV27_09905 [Candidatus Binataceae bacterium]|nr:hypothetical protein [Candidatus Binataceae bacterium]